MSVELAWFTTDESEATIAYSGSTIVIGIKQAGGILTINMPIAFAVNLTLELRETLLDLNKEDTSS